MSPRTRRRPAGEAGRSQNGSGGAAETEDTPTREHPARYTPAIIDALGLIIEEHGLPVFDPFAGTGERLGELCDALGVAYSGTDLEEWPGRDPRVAQGDATDEASYPVGPHLVATSPTYGNGLADHFEARDGSRRYTYRAALGRPLHENNTGRYGRRAGLRSWSTYWSLNTEAVRLWAALGWPAAVNVKDFIHAGERVPLVDLWALLLENRGYRITRRLEVPCPGIRHGANSAARVDHEVILCAEVDR